MKTRLIGLFPQFSTIDQLQELRLRWDPLAPRIAPHVPLFGPFTSSLPRFQLRDHLVATLEGQKPFMLEFQGLESVEDTFLAVRCRKGEAAIERLFKRLQSGILESYLPVLPPRKLLVGRFADRAARDAALQLSGEKTPRVTCQVTAVQVQLLDEKRSTELEFEYLF